MRRRPRLRARAVRRGPVVQAHARLRAASPPSGRSSWCSTGSVTDQPATYQWLLHALDAGSRSAAEGAIAPDRAGRRGLAGARRERPAAHGEADRPLRAPAGAARSTGRLDPEPLAPDGGGRPPADAGILPRGVRAAPGRRARPRSSSRATSTAAAPSRSATSPSPHPLPANTASRLALAGRTVVANLAVLDAKGNVLVAAT